VTIYAPGRIEVQPGDFAAVRTRGDVSRLIRVGQFLNGDGFGDWEHAIFYAGGPQDLILEAEPGGARLVPYHYQSGDVLWSATSPRLDLAPEQRDRAMDTALRYRGIPYSSLDYDALALHRLHIPAPGLKEYIGSTRSMICSQLADQCRLDLGSHLFKDNRWPGYVTPLSLADLIEGK
jgi:hypothetical protein